MMAWPDFLQDQKRRLTVRWIVVSYTLISLAFWTAAILSAAWLREIGLGRVVYVAGIIWLYFALPTLYVHAQFVLDVCGYCLTRTTYFFPQFQDRLLTATTGEQSLNELSPAARGLYLRLRPFFRAASFTSPIVGIATWSLIVLIRMPSDAHRRAMALTPSGSPARSEIRMAIRTGRRIETLVTEGYTQRQFALVV